MSGHQEGAELPHVTRQHPWASGHALGASLWLCPSLARATAGKQLLPDADAMHMVMKAADGNATVPGPQLFRLLTVTPSRAAASEGHKLEVRVNPMSLAFKHLLSLSGEQGRLPQPSIGNAPRSGNKGIHYR